MTVHSNDSGVMNAVSTRPITASPTTPSAAVAPTPAHLHHHLHNHHNIDTTTTAITTQTTTTTSAPPNSLTASVASAVAAAAAAAAAAATATANNNNSNNNHNHHHQQHQHLNMAVTSTVPPGARSVSPCAVAAVSAPTATPYASTPVVSAATPAAALPPSAVVSALGGTPPSAAVVPPPGPPPSAGANRCCETGRTIYTDPVSGQTLCSCQYDMLNYQRLAAGGLVAAAPGGVPLGVYPEGMTAYLSGMTDQAPFYANPAGLDLKENLVAGAAPWPYPSVYHPYDAAFAGYPFNSYGMDLNGARRKNATRETTSTLKAWLNEHKKNPYPTKGEKIMLAIITKMTLTQVSTWFANARRRLKKENKMTWEPRNRVDDDDANIDDDDHKSTDDNDLLDAKDSGLGSNEDKDRSGRLDMLGGDRPGESNNSEWSGSRPGSPNGSPDLYERGNPMLPSGPGPAGHPLFHPAALHHHFRPPAGSPPDIAAYHHHQQQLLQQHHHHQQQQAQQNSLHAAGVTVSGVTLGSTSASLAAKPRIWSLADMASKDGKDSNAAPKDGHSSPGSDLAGAHPALYAHPAQHASPGKILSPLAARIPNYAPYVRPDLYRGFYGTGLAGGPTPEFLEHQRTFGASLAAHNGLGMNPLLWKAAVSGAAASGAHFAPLSLTTANNHNASYVGAPPSGASPSASSTSSSIGCDVVQLSSGGSGGGNSTQNSSQQHHLGPISGNSTCSSTSSNSGKMSPSINVTSLGNSNVSGGNGKP